MTDRSEPSPLEYASPSKTIAVSPLPTILAYSVVYLVVATISFFAEPRVEVLAKDFKMDLPGYTKLFFAFNRWFRQDLGWLWLLPIPVAVPVALTRLVQLGKGSREIRHWRLVGITSMILLLIGIASAMAIVVPVYQLVYQISSPAPKH